MSMPSLKDFVTGWTGFPKIESTFGPVRMRSAAMQVSKQLGDLRPRTPDPYDLRILYKRVVAVWNRDRSLDGMESRDLRRLPWVLFYPPQHGSRTQEHANAYWLGARPRIVQQFGRWLSSGYRTGANVSLLREFLRVYPSDLGTFDDIRQLLRNTIELGSPPAATSLRRWRQRCSDFALLGDDRGLSFVDKLVSATDDPDDILLDAGLERCGLLKSGVCLYLRKARTLLEKNRLSAAHLGRLLGLLESNGSLRFDEYVMRKEIAEALLRPFANRPPDAGTKGRLQPFFLHHFRDPRLPSGKNQWSGIPYEIRRVVIRWLVERALEQFFALIKDTALDKHWRYREAFWRAFLNQDLIDDIWFVLGPRAESRLRKINAKEGEAETTAALRGSVGDQSVLLLRMPGLTIAEWSHNGSCRFWLDRPSGRAPELYRDSYSRSDLTREADFSQRHDGSLEGRWQDEIAEWLRNNTGIQIDRTDYFPIRVRERGHPHSWRYPFR